MYKQLSFDPFVKTAENGEWWAAVDRFRQIYELRVVIVYLPSDIAIPFI